jgi:protein ImuA
VVLVNPPHEPFMPVISAAGLAAADLMWVGADTPAAQLWAAEQALRCADIHAVLAWLPQARVPELRRLHLAAAQHARVLLLALRADRVAHTASPALLRLHVASAGPEALRVHILKRRGPPLVTPLQLPAQTPSLHALLDAERQARTGRAGAQVLPFDPARSPTTECHVSPSITLLDRPALAA